MIYRESEFAALPPRPIAPASARIGTKKRGGLGMAVEKRDKRIVIYLTESECQALTWAAAFRGNPPGGH